MDKKDLQDIENKVRSSQMRYLDTVLSINIYLRINELLYLIDQRTTKGQAFYYVEKNPLAMGIPDIDILQKEVAFLRNKLKAASKGNKAKKRRKRSPNSTNQPGKPVKRMVLPVWDISGDIDAQSQKPDNQGNQAVMSGSATGQQPQSPVYGNYPNESKKWTYSEIADWKGKIKDKLNSVAYKSDEEQQETIAEISGQNDGIIKSLTEVVNKEPTTKNITMVIEQIAISQVFGGDDSIASEAFEAAGNATMKRLKASYSIYKIMNKKDERYFHDLLKDLAAAQLLGNDNDPVMNEITSEITKILASGTNK